MQVLSVMKMKIAEWRLKSRATNAPNWREDFNRNRAMGPDDGLMLVNHCTAARIRDAVRYQQVVAQEKRSYVTAYSRPEAVRAKLLPQNNGGEWIKQRIRK